MVPAIPVVLVVGAFAAKAVSAVWLASMATSPVAVGSRKRFLEHTEEALDNIEFLKDKSYTPERIAELREQVKLLQTHIREGWKDTHLFNTVLGIASFKAGAHVGGGIGGTIELVDNYLTKAVNWLFKPSADAPHL